MRNGHRARPVSRYPHSHHALRRLRAKVHSLRELLLDALNVTIKNRVRIASLEQQLAAADLNLAEAHEVIRDLRCQLRDAGLGVPV